MACRPRPPLTHIEETSLAVFQNFFIFLAQEVCPLKSNLVNVLGDQLMGDTEIPLLLLEKVDRPSRHPAEPTASPSGHARGTRH
jgi:hypothetical protein